jgi:putative transposase
MKKVTEELLGKEFSSGTISRYASQLDAELDAWRTRSFQVDYPYVIVDARYDKCRVGSKIVDIAVLTAIGVDQHGYRHFLAIESAWGETNTSWDNFFAGLKERGLDGVRLFTSDHHPGIRNAIKKNFPGTQWQRCQRHFLVNAMDKVPKRDRDRVHDELVEVWASHTYDQALQRLNAMATDWSDPFEGFAQFLSEEGLETLTVFSAVPKEHHKKLRTSNMVERTNQEFKRRGRVVRIFPNPESCIRLYGSLAKEWDEDWISGRKYINMESLWEWEKECASKAEELAPQPSKIPQEIKRLTVAL